MLEDLEEYVTAVKKGPRALEKRFEDDPEFDEECRLVFRVKKVEFAGGGLCHTITINAGEDPSSPDVTVPNPLWGLGSECHSIMEFIGRSFIGQKRSFAETVTRKQLHTNLEFVIRKLSGVVGVVVTRTDYQKIVGKKHVKNKRKRSKMEFGMLLDEISAPRVLSFLYDDFDHEGDCFSDEYGDFDADDDDSEDDQMPRSIPGLDQTRSKGELASAALEIEDVVADEAQHMLTISFKSPLRAFAQKSQRKDGTMTFEEVDPKAAAPAPAGSHQALGLELLGIAPRTLKMNLYFEGGWEDGEDCEDGEDSEGRRGPCEGKVCLEELRTYLAQLHRISEAVQKKRELVASFRKRQDQQKGRRFCDLPANSFTRKAVKEFRLDITKTGCWDSSVLEEEWRAWYELRQEAESRVQADFEEEEEAEEDLSDLGENDEDYFESTRFRRKMLKTLRQDYAKALKEAGFSAPKAKAAAQGLYINEGNVVDEGDGQPRTCTVSVRIFSAVGNSARFVDLEHEHHSRARAYSYEEFADIKAQVSAFDPETGTFQVAEDLEGTSDDFVLFGMDCDEQTRDCTYSLASANEVQKLVAAVFGQKPRGSSLTGRAAFRVFMMACGADAYPFTEMSYDEFCPLSYVDTKFSKKRKK